MGDCRRVRPILGGGPEGKLIEAVGAIYWRAPTAEDLSGTAYTPDDFPPPQVSVWPENVAHIERFYRVCTQWRTGPGGPIGLDYIVVDRDLERGGIAGTDYDEAMAAIRVMERTALDEIHKS